MESYSEVESNGQQPKFEDDMHKYEQRAAEEVRGLNEIEDPHKARVMAEAGKDLMNDALNAEQQAAEGDAFAQKAAERARTASPLKQKLVKFVMGESDTELAEFAQRATAAKRSQAGQLRNLADLTMGSAGKIYDQEQAGRIDQNEQNITK